MHRFKVHTSILKQIINIVKVIGIVKVISIVK